MCSADGKIMDGLLAPQHRRRWWWVGGVVSLLALALALGILVQRAAWAGPVLANGLRAIIGDRAVARLEEMWAGAQDRALRHLRRNDPPRALEDALPESSPSAPAPPARPRRSAAPARAPDADASAPAEEVPGRPVFEVDAVAPPFPEVAAAHDGQWFPISGPERPAAPALMYRTLIHPDPARSFAELFVVVMPLSQVALRLVAGTAEPESENPDVARLEPRGLIAAADEPQLLAAFNGGFRARHGRHGMLTDGVVLVPLRAELCTISAGGDVPLRIGTWHAHAAVEPRVWYRQTPPCMLEDGVLHPGLANPESRKWGSTLEGETVIRRSALALDREQRLVYVGVSNYTTARALALGMQSVGGWAVAQLDVNWSYPKILVFPRDGAGVRHAASVFSGFMFNRDEMLRRPSERDFFYVVRR